MQKIKVRKESFAERCEICHKADAFDPLNNTCKRCHDVFKEDVLTKVKHLFIKSLVSDGYLFVCSVTLTFIMYFGAIFLLFLGRDFNSVFFQAGQVIALLATLLGLSSIMVHDSRHKKAGLTKQDKIFLTLCHKLKLPFIGRMCEGILKISK